MLKEEMAKVYHVLFSQSRHGDVTKIGDIYRNYVAFLAVKKQVLSGI